VYIGNTLVFQGEDFVMIKIEFRYIAYLNNDSWVELEYKGAPIGMLPNFEAIYVQNLLDKIEEYPPKNED
jgi:hypothetical protein